MALKYKYSDIPMITGVGLKALCLEELERIHYGALYILEKVGLNVESEEAAEIFQGGGALVEKKNGLFHVKLPPNLVEDCLDWTPKNVIFYGRDKNFDYIAKPGE